MTIWFGLSLLMTTAIAKDPILGPGSYTCNYIDGLYKDESWMIFVAPPTADGSLQGGMELVGAQLSQMVELKVKADSKDLLTFERK